MIGQFTYSEIKSAYNEIKTILSNVDLYVCGGFVPFLLLNEDSQRLHHDIDCIVSLDDMDKIRNKLINTKYYIPNDDSINLVNNIDDYGLEVNINGITIGLYPYKLCNNKIYQYSYNADNKRFKIKILDDSLNNYLKQYKSYDGNIYKTISLEYLRKSKEVASRDKDLIDIVAIDKYGYDQNAYDNIRIPNPVNYQNKTLVEMKSKEKTDD